MDRDPSTAVSAACRSGEGSLPGGTAWRSSTASRSCSRPSSHGVATGTASPADAHRVFVRQNAELSRNAFTEARVFGAESALRVSPPAGLVEPDWTGHQLRRLPLIPWPDVRVHERVRVPQHVNVHPSKSRIDRSACALDSRGKQVGISEELHALSSRHLSEGGDCWILPEEHAVPGQELCIPDDREAASKLGEYGRVLPTVCCTDAVFTPIHGPNVLNACKVARHRGGGHAVARPWVDIDDVRADHSVALQSAPKRVRPRRPVRGRPSQPERGSRTNPNSSSTAQ